MEITKREIILSISIIVLMMILGLSISNKLVESKMDKEEKYNKALKIINKDIFEYGMKTNVGNAFVYGQLEAIDTVSYDDIPGEYLRIKKVREVYTRHTRVVTHTVNGKLKTKTETYWSWDYDGSEIKTSEKVKFLDIEFNTNKFIIPEGDYIDTIKTSHNVRYKYYGYPSKLNCTIFSYLSDNSISNNTNIYNLTIEETIESLQSNAVIVFFWICWIAFICILVYGFYYLDNNWLNN